jgi:hypothetical protein
MRVSTQHRRAAPDAQGAIALAHKLMAARQIVLPPYTYSIHHYSPAESYNFLINYWHLFKIHEILVEGETGDRSQESGVGTLRGEARGE